jgi:hypothetical protein
VEGLTADILYDKGLWALSAFIPPIDLDFPEMGVYVCDAFDGAIKDIKKLERCEVVDRFDAGSSRFTASVTGPDHFDANNVFTVSIVLSGEDRLKEAKRAMAGHSTIQRPGSSRQSSEVSATKP